MGNYKDITVAYFKGKPVAALSGKLVTSKISIHDRKRTKRTFRLHGSIIDSPLAFLNLNSQYTFKHMPEQPYNEKKPIQYLKWYGLVTDFEVKGPVGKARRYRLKGEIKGPFTLTQE